MPATIAPEAILRELAGLWVDLGKEAEREGATGVLRAVTMTLIVLAEEGEDPGASGETLAALMPEYPSRAIVIRVRHGDAAGLEARVFSQCWTPFGQRSHICCERVEIVTSEASLAEALPVVLPLAAPDLPVMLWCRSARLFELPAVAELARMARKVILDSSAFPDAKAILARMAALGMPVGDFSWTRLTRWRELIARVFQNDVHLAGLTGVTQVRVTWPSRISALYLGAWLRSGIESAGAQPRLECATGGEARVEVTGPGLQLRLSQTAEGGAELRTNNTTSRITPAPETEYGLMREELGIATRDPVFEKVLAEAAALAVSS
jgi:glucose-6-phosphate dehydrogenase assembly protein OpcA